MDSSHELEIACMSHLIAKDLDMLTLADQDLITDKSKVTNGQVKNEQSPNTEVGQNITQHGDMQM